VVGPFVSGVVLQRFGFRAAFLIFALLALAGAAIFTILVPETKRNTPRKAISAMETDTSAAA
jgi:predicted MFS family arabinose efflux permease